MELRLEEISKIIRSQIKHYESTVEHDETGSVVLVGDGIARVSGLDKCAVNELVEFSNFAVGLKEVSVTAPVMTFFILVRTKAAPLPGLTCWNSMTCMTWPSISKVTPFLKSPAVIINGTSRK